MAGKTGRTAKFEYVVYRGDDIVCSGTRREIMELMNIAGSTFDRMSSGLAKKEEMVSQNRLVAERVAISDIKEDKKLIKLQKMEEQREIKRIKEIANFKSNITAKKSRKLVIQ